MVLVNSTTIQLRDGARGGLQYLLGNALIAGLICVVGGGLLGAAFTTFVEREVVSTGVDTVLALVLLGYGIHLLRQDRHPAPNAGQNANNLTRGCITMATNFTSIPLLLAASQHLGASNWPVWAVVPGLAVVMSITLLPAWLPVLLAKIMPSALARIQAHQQHGHQNGWGARISGLLPVATCFLGAAALILHAVSHL